jgi:nanoRNase/pAp phosphatase (c-di-AMP/oligoRNAs hydrolase)
VCSAYAVKELMERMDPSITAEIVLAGGASRLSRRVVEALDIDVAEGSSAEDADAFVVLDSATLSQLDEWGRKISDSNAPVVFIDHHAPHPEIVQLGALRYIDEDSTSTCEVVHALFEAFGVEPSAKAARALLIGMAFDSKHFTMGTAKTFRTVSRLLEIDGSVEDAIALLKSEAGRSERIARLKAAQRMQIHNIENWTMVTSHVSSFQASVARALLVLGGDVAIVAGESEGKVKVSLRSTMRFSRETSIHLGRDVAMPLGQEFAGAGSGHASSAGVNAKGNVRHMLGRTVELVAQRLKEYPW